MFKKLFMLLTVLSVTVLPSHAVLKEKDLEQTLVILRQDITNYYQNLLHEADFKTEQSKCADALLTARGVCL